MSDHGNAERVLKQVPPAVQMTVVVTIGMVAVALIYFGHSAYVAKLAAERQLVSGVSEIAVGESFTSTEAAEADADANPETDAAPPLAASPPEEMLPWSKAEAIIDRLDEEERRHEERMERMEERHRADRERDEKRHREELASRDRQIDRQDERMAGMQAQIDAMSQAQIARAWDAVDWFKQQNAGGIHGRVEFQPAREQRGPVPQAQPDDAPAQVVPAAVVDDPFDAVDETKPAEPKPKFRRRSGYLNVNPDRRVRPDGIPAGSARARLRDADERHRSAVGWTQRYYGRSGSSRVLGEMEAGGR